MVKKKSRYKIRTIRRVTGGSGHGNKFSPYAFGHAFGMVSVTAILFYAVMAWFSSYTGTVIIRQYPIAFSFFNWTIIIGLLQTYVLSYIGGWIFAKVYNESV